MKFNPACRDCPRLARFLARVRREHPEYYALPVAPFGDTTPRLLIVGLAPGLHGANRTGRPFTGDHAGVLLYQTLHRFGFASAAQSLHAADSLQLVNCRITNAVKCVPPQNRPITQEIKQCNRYLQTELAALDARAVVLALGGIAHKAVLLALAEKQARYPFRHGAHYELPGGLTLFDSYHCSRYNTQTRRLTAAMFVTVIADISKLLDSE